MAPSFEHGIIMFVNLPVRVVRVGNSRAVLIPAIAARELGWEPGTELTLDADEDGKVRLEKREAKKEKKR